MKVLNLYACLGGNRLLWDDCEVTSVELDPELARMYGERFPNDKVIVADAHQYLLDHYQEFDFIWSSPPCQSHSRTNYFLNPMGIVRYPDMSLWQEIIFLKEFSRCKWVVENVTPYYDDMFNPIKIGRHYFWSNFVIPKIEQPKDDIGKMCGQNQTASKKTWAERQATNSDLGKHIFDLARGIYKSNNVNQQTLF